MELQSRPSTPPGETAGRLADLLAAGLIESIGWHPRAGDEPDFAHCHGRIRVPGRAGETLATGGTAITPLDALVKAIGESAERYCALVPDPAGVRVARARDLGDSTVDPRRFVLFHDDQIASPGYPFARLENGSEVGWVEGFSLTRRAPALVPASMVHLSYAPRTPADGFESCPVSGYACGNSREEALLGALCEVVERDALMVSWYCGLEGAAIGAEVMSAAPVAAALGRFDVAPARVTCVDLTTDLGVPVVLAAASSERPGWPAVTVGLSCAPSSTTATAGALGELAADLVLVRAAMAARAGRPPIRPDEVVRMEDHGLLYAPPAHAGRLAGLLGARRVPMLRPAAPDSGDVTEQLWWCVERLAEAGLEAIAVDLTRPEVAAHGLVVVKVLVPGAQPIDFGTRWRHFGGARLYEAPARMGIAAGPRHPSQLVRFPHPFP